MFSQNIKKAAFRNKLSSNLSNFKYPPVKIDPLQRLVAYYTHFWSEAKVHTPCYGTIKTMPCLIFCLRLFSKHLLNLCVLPNCNRTTARSMSDVQAGCTRAVPYPIIYGIPVQVLPMIRIWHLTSTIIKLASHYLTHRTRTSNAKGSFSSRWGRRMNP